MTKAEILNKLAQLMADEFAFEHEYPNDTNSIKIGSIRNHGYALVANSMGVDPTAVRKMASRIAGERIAKNAS